MRLVGRVTQLVQWLATDWTVRGSNPVWGEIFRTCPDRSWNPPSLLYNGYRVFPEGKERPGRDADPSPPSSAVGHEIVELYLYSPYGPYGLYRASVPVQGWPLPLPCFWLASAGLFVCALFCFSCVLSSLSRVLFVRCFLYKLQTHCQQ